MAVWASVGEVWEQKKGAMTGRRGRITRFIWTHWPNLVALDPVPGTCPCPRKQRRTTIPIRRLLDTWEKVET